MNARAPLVIAASAVVACAQIVGIGQFAGEPDAGADAPSSDVASDTPQYASCTNAVLRSSSGVDSISVAGGFVFAQAFQSGISRCAVGTSCIDPASLVNVPVQDTFGYAATAASLVYSVTTTLGGTIHRAALDATNDTTLVTTAANPSYVAIGTPTLTYWVDDNQPASVHCVGCLASDAVWIQNVDNPTALFADATSVYVVALDNTGVTSGVFSCGASAACANQPPVVISGLPKDSIGPTNVVSDGARVYVPRVLAADIVSVGPPNNTIKPLVTNVQGTALAVDAVSGELFYGTIDGRVGRVKSDGTASSTLSICQSEILSIAFDDANVYVLVTDSQFWMVYSIAR